MGKRSTKEKGVRAALAAVLGVAGIAGATRSAEANPDQNTDINQNHPPAKTDYATSAELGADEKVTNIDSLHPPETERQQEMPREGYCLTISQGIDVNTGQAMMDTFYFDLDGNQISQKAVDNLLAGSGHLIIETTEITDDTKLPGSLIDEIISQRNLGNTPHLTGFKLAETSPGSSRRVQEGDSLESSDSSGVKVAAAMPGGEVLEEDGPITPTEGGGSPTDESGSEKIESTSPTDEFQGGSEITEVALNTLADNYGETMITSQASTDEKNMILAIAEVLPADYDRYQVTKAKIRFLDFYILTVDGANVIYAKESGTIHWQKVESLEDLERMVRLSYEGWSVNEVTAGNLFDIELHPELKAIQQEIELRTNNPYLFVHNPGTQIGLTVEEFADLFDEYHFDSRHPTHAPLPAGIQDVVFTDAEKESYAQRILPLIKQAAGRNQSGTTVLVPGFGWEMLPISSESMPPISVTFRKMSSFESERQRLGISENDPHIIRSKRINLLVLASFENGILNVQLFMDGLDAFGPGVTVLHMAAVRSILSGSPEIDSFYVPAEHYFIKDPKITSAKGYPFMLSRTETGLHQSFLDTHDPQSRE